MQLDHILAETIEGRWARHDALRRPGRRRGRPSGATHRVPPEGARSWTVSCLEPRAGISPEALVAKVKERGFTIGGGYGKWKASTFRIGHMGDVDMASLETLLAALDDASEEAASAGAAAAASKS